MTAVFSVLFSIVNECIKKWKGLRDTYRKNRRKEKERRRSGAGACGGKAWKYARIMAFIDPFMEDRHSQTNMAGPVSEKDTDQAAPGRAMVEDQDAPGRAQAADLAPQAEEQAAPQAEEQAAGKRRKTGRGRDQSRDALDAEAHHSHRGC